MGLKYYQTAVGLFPVIADDTYYNFLTSLSSTQGSLLDSQWNPTAEGTALAAVIPSGLTMFGYRRFDRTLDYVSLTNLSNFLGCSVQVLDTVYTTSVDYPVGGSPDRFLRCSQLDGIFVLRDTAIMPGGNTCGAVVFTTTGYGGDLNGTYMPLLYCNSAMTSFINVLIRAYSPSPLAGASYELYYASTSENTLLTEYFTGINPVAEDPYAPGGETATGGGTGTFDNTGDDIDIPSIPTLSAVDAGFITLFNPTLSDMNTLASYMWSDPLFDVAAWKKIFADPMDAILGLSIVPVAVPDGGTKTVKVGNISTGITMPYAASQYVEVDCGTLSIEEYWGAYLDYDPYTKAELYLPYIGTHPIAVDDIMGKSVHVVYHVDILSGACCAYVKCGSSVLYTFLGQCSSSIPITGDNWTNVINGALNIAGSIGSMVATGGATAPMTAGSIASTVVNQMKPTVEKSGSLSGTGGMMAVQTPYLILTRPRQAMPSEQNVFMGYPSFITSLLSDLSGYTEIESAHLTGIPATNAELSEIETLLKSGVIF